MTETQRQVIKWLAHGHVSESSKCMAFWLAFDERLLGAFPPCDPSDLNQCLQLLEWAPGLRADLPKMATLSDKWAALAARWDEVEASYLTEVGPNWTKGRLAPETASLLWGIVWPKENSR